MYPLLKHIHVAVVASSILLFVLRSILMLSGSPRLHAPVLRALPHLIDTVLLASGVALIAVLGTGLLEQSWLQVKLVMVLAYIAAGSVALKRGKTHRVRVLALFVALTIVALIIVTAVAHRPMGLDWL